MLHKKTHLSRYIPAHPVMRGIMFFFAAVGLVGLFSSVTHADLAIETSINNVIGTFKELRITTDGSPAGSTRVILSSGGIWVDSGSIGGPTNGVLKLNSLGYITRALVSGDNIATGVITTGMLAFDITSGATSFSGTTTLSCDTGEVMVGVSGGVAACLPIIATGDCTGSGYVVGWTSTGAIMCSDTSGTGGTISAGGSSLRHPSITNPFDIYYGTFVPDNNGNVGIGLDSPLAKLHVLGTFRVDSSGTVLYPTGMVSASMPVAPTTLYATGTKVGINTLTPQASLDVVGSVRFRSYGGSGTRNLGIDTLGNIVITTGGAGTNIWQDGSAGVIYYNGGNVGIRTNTPGATLHVNGDILTNATYIISDETLKENIKPITGAIAKLLQLHGYTFNWIANGKADVGVLAQEVESVFPEIVKTMNDGTKAVEYPNLVALLIQAVKEMNTLVDQLRTEYTNMGTINNLFTQYQANASTIASLSNRLNILENNQDAANVSSAQGKGFYLCVLGSNMNIDLPTTKTFCNEVYTPFLSTRDALRLLPDDTHLQDMYDTLLAQIVTFFQDHNVAN